MTRHSGDYDPDEGARYDGYTPWHDPFECPEYCAQALAECTAMQAAFDAHQARLYGQPVQSSDDRHCPTCHGTGATKDVYAYGPDALPTCYRCGGARTR